jgi:intermediate cleaving peptidase 55
LRYRSGAVFYPYRQESNFLYLTGFNEPESVAVIRKTSSRARPNQYHFHLFVRAKDPKAEQWSGPWSGLDAARDVFNADAVSDIADLHRLLPSMLRKNDSVFLNEETSNTSLTGQIKAILESSVTSKKVRAVQKPLNSLRVVKSQAEVANMRRAGRLSGQVITAAMRRSWTSEKELADYLGYDFSRQGCDGPAYVPVVAGGPRGSMIHYTLNNALLNEEELVLVDAGGEYGTYITDISRTWPVRGRFAPAQRDLYEAVLKVQRKVLTMCTRRADLTLDKLHQITEDGLKQELLNLGFDMSGDAINVLFPHHVGHYIGLDVHDVPGYARSMPLTVGTCITVEPGIYVPDDERWPKHFRGMAIRIEDSVCVDDDSPYVLTTEAVKEVSDIEALRD